VERRRRKAPQGLRHFSYLNHYARARESSDSPRLNAFCRVAPSVRLRVRAILVARVFLRASVFNVRTSDRVHERRFLSLAIYRPPSGQWISKIFGVGDWIGKVQNCRMRY
jgi:hypothetical protein